MLSKLVIFLLGIFVVGLFYWYYEIEGNNYTFDFPQISFSLFSKNETVANLPTPLPEGTTVDTIELLRHSSKNDCWIAIRGNVYDVTLYLKDHPDDFIVQGCGIDATRQFEKRITQSGALGADTAVEVLKNYYIGKFVKTSKF